jgi:basic membrane protein A
MLRKNGISLVFVFTTLLAIVLASCAPAATTAAPTTAPTTAPQPIATSVPAQPTATTAPKVNVAVVFASSGLGDKSFNDSLFKGITNAATDFGITWKYAEPHADTDYEVYMRQYAQSGEYNLIIANGFSQGSSLGLVAPDFPSQKFMIIDTEVDQPNVASYTFESEGAAYLAGVVAGLACKDPTIPFSNNKNTIGFVGGMDIPLINAFAAGYKAGALSVNPDIKVLIAYVGSWADPAKAKELALAQFQQGADIVYQVASQGGLGVIEGAKENGFLAIGQDDNQNYLAPDNMLLSVLKRIDNAGYQAVKSIVDGTWKAGVHNLGLADGGVDITFEQSNIKVPDSIMQAVATARQGIISGTIVVPTTLQ